MIRNLRVAAATAAAFALGIVLFSIWTRHSSPPAGTARTRAEMVAPADGTIERALRDSKLTIRDLSVRSSSGIVILRGSADPDSAHRAVDIVKSLGVTRVANLISTATIDDDAIRRDAERELGNTGALTGCLLKVECQKGVLSVTGTVQHELQKDAARSALRNVRGAREVRVNLSL